MPIFFQLPEMRCDRRMQDFKLLTYISRKLWIILVCQTDVTSSASALLLCEFHCLHFFIGWSWGFFFINCVIISQNTIFIISAQIITVWNTYYWPIVMYIVMAGLCTLQKIFNYHCKYHYKISKFQLRVQFHFQLPLQKSFNPLKVMYCTALIADIITKLFLNRTIQKKYVNIIFFMKLNIY